MFKVHKVQRQIGQSTLTIETGKIARQAHGAVTVKYGETIVLVSATMAPPRSEDIDYLPLSVDYREKYSAAGKFPGGFMKREGRPTTKEILTARMIDRPIRPLFPDSYYDEVQVMISVLSADAENDPDILGMIGASAALAISKIPFQGPIGACRLGRVNGEFVINPTCTERKESDFNLILAGRREAINMIEVDAKEVPEDVVAEGVSFAHKTVQDVCDMINELVEMCGVEKIVPDIETNDELVGQIAEKYAEAMAKAYRTEDKAERNEAVAQVFQDAGQDILNPETPDLWPCTKRFFKTAMHDIQKDAIRQMLLEGKRPDGRGPEQVRPIECEVGLLPRSHGSALFTRGETQALVSVTLGTGRDEQIIDGLVDEHGQSFMLHYNFPPYSVGEVRFIRGPGRREIGHGALAEKALEQVRPDQQDFPYTIKIVSDITESNGSSSQASICGGCLALMDAGVPLKKSIAGISIGLVSDENKHLLLTDIMGDEDHFGEMDFKVAGSTDGITAIQLDIKKEGLSHDIMVEALERARQARLDILDIMSKAIDKPREDTSPYAPKITSIKINPDLIGKIIGPGGKVIKGIQEQTGAVIEINDDGTVCISSVGGDGYLQARSIIESMTTPPEIGKIYETSKVVSVKDFGCFVEIAPGVEGLCHVSELSNSFVKNVSDVCKEGDIVPVKLINIDDLGRLKLSRKAALKDLGIDEKEGKTVSES